MDIGSMKKMNLSDPATKLVNSSAHASMDQARMSSASPNGLAAAKMNTDMNSGTKAIADSYGNKGAIVNVQA